MVTARPGARLVQYVEWKSVSERAEISGVDEAEVKWKDELVGEHSSIKIGRELRQRLRMEATLELGQKRFENLFPIAVGTGRSCPYLRTESE